MEREAENNAAYTVVTFSPVQEFIEKSRKLRDLYGSSFLLSYLAYFTAKAAEAKGIATAKQVRVISPGLRSVVRGTPDYIIIQGDFSEQDAVELQEAFNLVWGRIVNICRRWLEDEFPERRYSWERHWKNWKNHAWEFFWGQGSTIEAANQDLYDRQYHQRNWIGINWEGDSSDLSGADAIAFPDMQKSNPARQDHDYHALKEEIGGYYKALSERVGEVFIASRPQLDRRYTGEDRAEKAKEYGEAIISPKERLNIPELIKRLVMIDAIADLINSYDNLRLSESQQYLQPVFAATQMAKLPKSFKEINRFEEEYWSGWFVGDGDGMGKYTKNLTPEELHQFSHDFLEWNDEVFRPQVEEGETAVGRLVFAGGDDFMGIFIPERVERKTNEILTGKQCWEWWQKFPQKIWAKNRHSKNITVSVGFVWAAPKVPQRAVLQHCNSAERNAKDLGKDRIAIRILFNSGNYLEWSCPWWFLSYRQRYQGSSWFEIFRDVAQLEARHGFDRQVDTSVAQEIFAIYFGRDSLEIFGRLWNDEAGAGIIGDRQLFVDAAGKLQQRLVNEAVNNWVINFAKVGFHLFRHE